METYLKLLNVMRKVETKNLTERTLKNQAMNVIIKFMRDSDMKFTLHPKKGFIEMEK